MTIPTQKCIQTIAMASLTLAPVVVWADEVGRYEQSNLECVHDEAASEHSKFKCSISGLDTVIGDYRFCIVRFGHPIRLPLHRACTDFEGADEISNVAYPDDVIIEE